MNIEETLKFLEPLYPITGAIHVGVGGPHNLNVYKTLGVEKLLLIEANQTRCEIIKKHIPEDKDWKVVNQVVADIEGEAQYYELNNKNESGLIPPEKLKPIWPNIKLVEERTETVTTLDSLVCKYTEEEVREKYNLLVIDCLSSLSILKGADICLKAVDAICISVLGNKPKGIELTNVMNPELEDWLVENYFVKLSKTQSFTPQIKHHIYFKDKEKFINSEEANYFHALGQELFDQEQFGFANSCVEMLISKNQENAYFHQLHGETLARLGKWEPSVRAYREALKLDHSIAKEFYDNILPDTQFKEMKKGPIPLFVIGCGHSGTSVLLAMIGQHPNVFPVKKESAIFLGPDSKAIESMKAWDKECESLELDFWVEKTPPHVFQIARFKKFRPQAKFLMIIRDGRDVVCSLKVREHYKSFDDRLDRWIYDNIAGLEFADEDFVHVLKYENLILKPEQELKKISEFIGLDYSPEMLNFHKEEKRWYSDEIVKPTQINNHSDHMNLRNWQINQPLFDGRGRWEKELSLEERKLFKKSKAQELLVQLNYVNDCNW